MFVHCPQEQVTFAGVVCKTAIGARARTAARGLVRTCDNLGCRQGKAPGVARMVLDVASPTAPPASAFSLTHIDPYLVCK